MGRKAANQTATTSTSAATVPRNPMRNGRTISAMVLDHARLQTIPDGDLLLRQHERRAGEGISRRGSAGRVRGGTRDAAGSPVVLGIRKFCHPCASTRYDLLSRGQQGFVIGRWSAAGSAASGTPGQTKLARGVLEGWPHPPCRCSGQSQPHRDHTPNTGQNGDEAPRPPARAPSAGASHPIRPRRM